MEKPIQADSIDVDSKEKGEVQWTTTNMFKKRMEEVSIKLSLSKGDMQTNINNEQSDFCYIACEHRKKG
ncbi:hypothetical protein R3W88_032028 [Solanum pinnatisectum]|uniref:Uncharacterized protein n=1 Tax=Solanum pinnatisectum TaxID=50273 RepID=A0AAV9LN00_9SOLN|nr:hypothetical protein R3W88_032028 [Solanum pinnatisectum]